MNVGKLWASLIAHVSSSRGPASLLDLLKSVQQWLREHPAVAGSGLGQRYGLPWYQLTDLEAYPLAYSDLCPVEEIRKLSRVPPSSAEVAVMFLRDLFWGAMVMRSAVSCPNCEGDDLRVLVAPPSDEIVLACDSCGWSQTQDGEPWSSAERPIPPTEIHLRDAGLLPGAGGSAPEQPGPPPVRTRSAPGTGSEHPGPTLVRETGNRSAPGTGSEGEEDH